MGRALKPGTLNDLKGHQLAIAIYWKPRRGPDALSNGHAALIIDFDAWAAATNPDPGSALYGWMVDREWYVSWLGGKIAWSPVKGSKGGSKGIAGCYIEDAENWGGEKHGGTGPLGEYQWPTRWVAVEGLNTQAMHDAWEAQRNKGGGAHWRLFDKNCATMVHTILKAGGGDEAATAAKKQLVWWPTDLIRYAKSMRRNGATVFARSSDPQAQFL
jgi:hypothetical protein